MIPLAANPFPEENALVCIFTAARPLFGLSFVYLSVL